MLSWNIRNFGPGQVNGHNAPHLFNYIARTILSANADIASIMEVANSVSVQIATGIINSLNAMAPVVFPPVPSPWRFRGVNNGFNEAYLILFRVDRTFLPLNSTGGITTGPNVVPDSGLTNQDIHGDNTVQFPRPGQRRGGVSHFTARSAPMPCRKKLLQFLPIMPCLAYTAVWAWKTFPNLTA